MINLILVSVPSIVGIVIGAIILIIIIGNSISTSNKIERYKVKIDEASSSIDTCLTARFDILTKALDATKNYMKYEKETLLDIVKLRKGMTTSEQNEITKELDTIHKEFNVVLEQYPELRSAENVKTLQLQIEEVEENLQASRRFFNSNISLYNQIIVTFPSSIIASIKKCTKKDFFVAEEFKKQDVKISF